MFDHLLHARTGSGARKRPRAATPLFIGAASVAAIAILALSSIKHKNVVSVTRASEPELAVSLVEQGIPKRLIFPLRNTPIALVDIEVKHSAVELTGFEFTLDGVYNPAAWDGVRFFVDGAQVGASLLPDANGLLATRPGPVLLPPGMHRLMITLTASERSSVTALQLSAVPERALTFAQDDRVVPFEMYEPYRGPLLVTAEHGVIGTFVQGRGREGGSDSLRLYLYAEDEDFDVLKLSFTADRDLTGSRIDIFEEGVFIGSALFDGRTGEADVTDAPLKILRRKNTVLDLVVSELDGDDLPRLTLSTITARGIVSGSVLEHAADLELLHDLP